MKNSLFKPEEQHDDVANKIVVGLERLSQAFKTLLWEKAKTLGLSPIQIQILIFVAYHKGGLNNVSLLAQEFNVTKPTVSDAVKILDKKGLITKDYSSTDSRSYSISLSEAGKNIVSETDTFADPIKVLVNKFGDHEKSAFYQVLSKLIFQLNQADILTVQRTCYACKFYRKDDSGHYCNYLEKPLRDSEIRLDCPEFEGKVV
ncbi:MarR family winged helix-turn-helix transcriptional regulator [Allomuricauda sp. d1]|uniref:MarR family winged helix-turn-helix transcriptional regulator n=1 Tax=Allomuricauda sp. d1 TaxID=3136725 RepID=UPI0031D31C11